MNGLEHRYRRVLRVLPADYRDRWEEEMVDTFLRSHPADDPEFEAEYGRPGWAEVCSVLALAVRLRLGGTGAPARAFARGEVVRRVALAGLLVHAVAAVAGLVSMLVGPARWPDQQHTDPAAVLAMTELVWVAAFLALVTGRRRTAAGCAVAALVPAVGAAGVELAAGGISVEVTVCRVLLTALPVLALAAFHREAPPVPARPWLIALPVGAAVTTAVHLLTQAPGEAVLDWPGTLCVAVVGAAVVHLAAGRPGPWSGALAVLAVAVLSERVVTVLDHARFAGPGRELDLLVAAGLVQAAAVALVTVPLVVRHVRARPARA